MREKTMARSDRGTSETLARVRARIRNGARVAAAIALVAGCSSDWLLASEVSVSSGPTIQRSMRIVPRKFVISPSGPTVATNQTQRFSVIDIDGKPVTVRWNISGLGCYGATCGSIDEEGVYRPPASLPKPRVVTLEGVVVSDPRFSVLTEIRLEDAPKSVAAPALAKDTSDKSPLPAPLVPPRQELARRAESVQTPSAVASAPTVRGLAIERATGGLLLPSVVGAAPTVGTSGLVSRVEQMPVSPPVAAAPTIGATGGTRSGNTIPLPAVVDATPAVSAHNVGRAAQSPSLPMPVAAVPVVENPSSQRKLDVTPLPSAVAAAPSVETQSMPKRATSMPTPRAVSAPPTVDAAHSATSTLILEPLPAAAPRLEKREAAKTDVAEPGSKPVVASHKTEPGRAGIATAELVLGPSVAATAPPVQRPVTASQKELTAPPRTVAAAPAPTVQAPVSHPPLEPMLLASKQGSAPTSLLPVSNQSGTALDPVPDGAVRVTYRNGQLTIDARNVPLAEVLKAVAQKTGATIDIPPGTGMERVFEHAGPGTPNDVLGQLLNGSHFNFILVNSPQNPLELSEVLLSVESAAPAPEVASAAPEPKESTSPFLYKKPPQSPNATATPQPIAAPVDVQVQVPVEQMTPDQRGDFMKDMFKKLNSRMQQQNPPQSPPPAPQQ